MIRRALLLAPAALAAVALPAAAPAADDPGPPKAPAEQRTSPSVKPATGTKTTAAFTVSFTLRSDAGVQGFFQTSYRVVVDAPAGARASCAPAAPEPVTDGAAGSTERVVLRRPAGGWCTGRYSATVLLSRGPYCVPPEQGGPPSPCPAFAAQDLDTGQAGFTVKKPKKKTAKKKHHAAR